MAKSISPNRIFIVGILVFGVSALLYVGMDQTSSLRYDFEQLRTVGGEYRGTGTPTDIKLEQLEEELEIAKQNIPEVVPFGQGQYAKEGGNWDSRCESPSSSSGSGGCGALGGDYFKRQQENQQSYIRNNVQTIENQISGVKGGAVNSVSCLVRASSFIVDTDGNQREVKSAFSIISDPVATYNFFDVNSGKETERFIVIPYIKCKTDQTLFIKPSEFGFYVESQNSQAQKIETFNGRGQSNLVTIEPANLLGLKTGDYSLEYPMMTFEIPVKYILQYLDAGQYTSYQEITVEAELNMYVKDQEDKILQLIIPRDAGENEVIRTWFEVKVNKEVDATSESAECASGQVRNNNGLCVNVDRDTTTGTGETTETVLPVNIFTEFLDYLITGQYDQLGNVKFYPFYAVGIGGLLLLSIFSSRSRQVVYYG